MLGGQMKYLFRKDPTPSFHLLPHEPSPAEWENREMKEQGE